MNDDYAGMKEVDGRRMWHGVSPVLMSIWIERERERERGERESRSGGKEKEKEKEMRFVWV